MMGSWWSLWIVFMFVFLVPALGYAWGYRGRGTAVPAIYPAAPRITVSWSGRPRDV